MEQHPENCKPKAEDKRESFRIIDSIAVILQKVEDTDFSSLHDSGMDDLEALTRSALQEGIPSSLLKILVHLYKKMDLIAQQIPVDILKVKTQPVNLSATGISIQTHQRFEVGDQVKIKLLLPTLPVREILVDGKVVRVAARGDGRYNLGLKFLEMDEEVREEIFHYSMKNQRKALLNLKQLRGENGTASGKGL